MVMPYSNQAMRRLVKAGRVIGDAPDLLLHSPSPLLPLERAGSSQTQGLPATSKQTAAKRKRVTLPRMPLATTRKQPYAPANVHAPDSHHATVKPSRQERTRRRECEHQAETLHRSKQRAAPKDGSLQSSYGPAYAFDAW